MTEIADAWQALNNNGFALDYDEDSRPGALAKAIDYALAAKDDEIGRRDERIGDLEEKVEQQQWKPIETAPHDGSMIELWHRHWECPIAAQWKIGFISDLPWIEKTKTTAWPTAAFTHWRHVASAPLSSTDSRHD